MPYLDVPATAAAAAAAAADDDDDELGSRSVPDRLRMLLQISRGVMIGTCRPGERVGAAYPEAPGTNAASAAAAAAEISGALFAP